MPIIAPIPRDERRLMQKAIHKTHDKNHARRLTAMLMLHRGDRVSDVARTLCCARSSVGRWINWFTLSGVEGLKSLPAAGRLSISAHCYASWSGMLPAILATSVHAGVQNFWQ